MTFARDDADPRVGREGQALFAARAGSGPKGLERPYAQASRCREASRMLEGRLTVAMWCCPLRGT
jgi:hypothetical protein